MMFFFSNPIYGQELPLHIMRPEPIEMGQGYLPGKEEEELL